LTKWSVFMEEHIGVKDEVAQGAIVPSYVPSADNLDDILTKHLSKVLFVKLRIMLGML
jgi:hypothetical protein